MHIQEKLYNYCLADYRGRMGKPKSPGTLPGLFGLPDSPEGVLKEAILAIVGKSLNTYESEE